MNYNISKEFLIKEYIRNKKSISQIAKEIKHSFELVRRRLIEYNISRRTISEANKGKLKGKKHPNYKNGNCLKKVYCIDCEKELSNHAYYYGYIRCNKCAKQRELHPFLGKHHTKKTKLKIRTKHLGKHSSPKTEFKKGQNKGKNNPMFGKIVHGKWGKYKNIWMRSSWEIVYAKYLDKNNIKWLYEPKRFNLGEMTYLPDFYLPEKKVYIEIKGYWRDDAKKKFKLFKKLYPKENIKVFDYHKLKELSIIK